MVALQHDGLQQEEADAVAALLAAASGLSSEDMHTSSHYPAGTCLTNPNATGADHKAQIMASKQASTSFHLCPMPSTFSRKRRTYMYTSAVQQFETSYVHPN